MAKIPIINKMPTGNSDPETMAITGYRDGPTGIQNSVPMNTPFTGLFIGYFITINSTLSAKIRAFEPNKPGLNPGNETDALTGTDFILLLSTDETEDRFSLTAMHNNCHSLVRTAG